MKIWLTWTNLLDFLDFIILISSLFIWLIHLIIMNILFSINRCWSFMMWYNFLSMESQGCLVIFIAIKSRTFLMCITRWSNTGVFMAYLGVRVDLTDHVSFLYSRGIRLQSLYMASPCMQSCLRRVCFLIRNAEIEHWAGTRGYLIYCYGWLFFIRK